MCEIQANEEMGFRELYDARVSELDEKLASLVYEAGTLIIDDLKSKIKTAYYGQKTFKVSIEMDSLISKHLEHESVINMKFPEVFASAFEQFISEDEEGVEFKYYYYNEKDGEAENLDSLFKIVVSATMI